MLDRILPETADLVRRLAAQGWQQRLIARQLQLSRSTVSRIVLGQWRPKTESTAALPFDDLFAEQRLHAKRCDGCGGFVYHWPCLTCEARARLQRKRLAA